MAGVLHEPAPVAAFEAARRLRHLPHPVLLDSSAPATEAGRYSYFTADPFLTLTARGRECSIGGRWERELQADPLELLRELLRRYRLPTLEGLPPLVGGAVGYFGYDLGRLLERLPATNPATDTAPDLAVGLYDWVLATDHRTGESRIISTGRPEMYTRRASERARKRASERLRQVRELLGGGAAAVAAEGEISLRSNTGRAGYRRLVERAREYIRAGDVYQVNLSHRLEGRWTGEAWSMYEQLRSAGSGVSHGAYLDLGPPERPVRVLSLSPERFLRLDDGRVQTRPIKGTRPRGSGAEEDRRLAAELTASEKDRAENVMIVDLLRNDLGRVCATGSVRVPELCALEAHTSVWHLVSTVTGELSPGLDAVDLLRASFPGGSVTGCPKVRAMEVIEELESVRRGVYCGSVGYLSFTGAMDTSIAIRTLVLDGDRLHLQVGGAVVADSDPDSEYRETLAKGKAVTDALGARLEEW